MLLVAPLRRPQISARTGSRAPSTTRPSRSCASVAALPAAARDERAPGFVGLPQLSHERVGALARPSEAQLAVQRDERRDAVVRRAVDEDPLALPFIHRRGEGPE